WRWGRRNPLVASLAAAVTLLALALLTLAGIGYRNVSQAWEETKRQRDQTRDMLRTALLDQAKAHRLSTEAGRRWAALDALAPAAAIRPDLDLRDEFLRCLDLADVRPVADWQVGGELPIEGKKGKSALPFSPSPLPGNGAGEYRIRTVLGKRPLEVDLRDGQVHEMAMNLEAWSGPAVLSPNGRFFAARLPDRKETRGWDLEANRCVAVLPFAAHLLAFSDRSDQLALTYERDGEHPVKGRNWEVMVYRLAEKGWDVAGSWKCAAAFLDCLKFNPKGTLLAAGTGLP